MHIIEAITLWLAIAGWTFSFVLYFTAYLFKKLKRLLSYAYLLTILALTFQFITIIIRIVLAHHLPVYGTYENSLTGSFFVGVIALFVSSRYKRADYILLFLIPLILFIVGNGVMHPEPPSLLPPPFRSMWLVIHIFFAWLAFGAYFIATALAVGVIAGHSGRFAQQLPEESYMDKLVTKFIVFGFVNDTAMIIAGAIWAYGLWGSYWSWDPIETWSFITWIIYGLNIHLRITMGWKGRKAAWLAVGSVIAVIISFFGIGFNAGIHTGLL